MKTHNQIKWACLTLFLIYSFGCGTNNQPKANFKGSQAIAIEHVDQNPLLVKAANGSIHVEQAKREDVQIDADIRAISQERLDAVEIIAERLSDGTLSIYAKWPDGKRKNNEGISYTIQIPQASRVDLTSSNGSLDLTGLDGEAKLNTCNGKINASEHRGAIIAKTSNGTITITNCSDTIDANTSNGKVCIEGARKNTVARTSNGSIEIASDAKQDGSFDVKTSNGSITLILADAFKGILELETSNGSINAHELNNVKITTKKKHFWKLQFGDSTQQSKAKTSNGKIHVKQIKS